MQQFLTWYCQLFGYSSCSAMSMLETLVLFGLLLAAVPVAILLMLAVLWAFGAALGAILAGIWFLFHPKEWWAKSD